MSQSSTIAFFLMFGFIVFVTMRGDLPRYAAVLGFGNASSGPGLGNGFGSINPSSTPQVGA